MVDDGSTDGTREIMVASARDFSEVRLLQNPRKGIAAARNTGIENIRKDCRFVAFLDADDLSYPGRIQRQRSRLLTDPAIDALYGMVEMFTQDNKAGDAPPTGSKTKIIRGSVAAGQDRPSGRRFRRRPRPCRCFHTGKGIRGRRGA